MGILSFYWKKREGLVIDGVPGRNLPVCPVCLSQTFALHGQARAVYFSVKSRFPTQRGGGLLSTCQSYCPFAWFYCGADSTILFLNAVWRLRSQGHSLFTVAVIVFVLPCSKANEIDSSDLKWCHFTAFNSMSPCDWPVLRIRITLMLIRIPILFTLMRIRILLATFFGSGSYLSLWSGSGS